HRWDGQPGRGSPRLARARPGQRLRRRLPQVRLDRPDQLLHPAHLRADRGHAGRAAARPVREAGMTGTATEEVGVTTTRRRPGRRERALGWIAVGGLLLLCALAPEIFSSFLLSQILTKALW